MATVTCHTEDCGNADQSIDVGPLTYEDEEGTTQEVGAVICGVCGQSITDIQ